MKESLIGSIIELEWEMFSTVPNEGGQASCQQDPETFRIMRHSQASVWPEKLLESYLGDLAAARSEGRNLMTEKYARMMETTFPREYKEIAGRLPAVDPDALPLIEEIVAANVAWKQESARRHPALNGRGRAIRSRDDTLYGTSFETYLRNELKTYSLKTLRLLHELTGEQKKNGLNAVEATLLHQVKNYGYASLEEAEAAQR